jgi:predicted transposase YdaD
MSPKSHGNSRDGGDGKLHNDDRKLHNDDRKLHNDDRKLHNDDRKRDGDDRKRDDRRRHTKRQPGGKKSKKIKTNKKLHIKPADRSYKYLFSDPVMLRQLLETCVDEPWVKQIDFSSLKFLSTEHVGKRLIASQNDLLFQVEFKYPLKDCSKNDSENDPENDSENDSENRSALLLVILEFQSSPEPFMALRLLHYLCAVYLSMLTRNKKKRNKHRKIRSVPRENQKLPPVFPVVLYKGDAPWNAPFEFSQLIDVLGDEQKGDSALHPLRAYVPRFRYFCIDEQRIDENWLHAKGNLISALFMLESADEHDIESKLHRLVDYIEKHLDQPENRHAARRLIEWFQMLLDLGLKDGMDLVHEEIRDRLEIKTMLEKTIARIKQKEHARGMAEGRAEGMAEGRAEGMAEGRAEGMAEGERKGRIKVAQNLLSQGKTPAEVAKLVELSEEEVRKLLH